MQDISIPEYGNSVLISKSKFTSPWTSSDRTFPIVDSLITNPIKSQDRAKILPIFRKWQIYILHFYLLCDMTNFHYWWDQNILNILLHFSHQTIIYYLWSIKINWKERKLYSYRCVIKNLFSITAKRNRLSPRLKNATQ